MLDVIVNKIRDNLDSNLELEIRLGNYSLVGFNSIVPEDKLNIFRSLNYLFKTEKETKITIELMNKNSDIKNRMVLHFDENYKKITDINTNRIKTTYFRKEGICKENMHRKSIRVSLAKEIITDKTDTKYDYARYKIRFCFYTHDGLFRYDLTQVREIEIGSIADLPKWDNIINTNSHWELEVEYIGDFSKIDINKIKSHIYLLENIDNLIYHSHRILEISKPFPFINFNHLINPTISLDFNNLNQIENDYCATEKIDGERRLLIVHNGSIFDIDVDLKQRKIYNTTKDINITVLDAEFYNNHYFIFDILVHKEKNVSNSLKLLERLELVKDIVKQINNNNISEKHFYFGNIYDVSKQILTKEYPYELDGIIYTPINHTYFNQSYKWKPVEKVTIDFLVYQLNNTKYQLFVGIDKEYAKENNYNIDYFLIKKYFPEVDLNENYVPIPFELSDGLSFYEYKNDDLKIEHKTIVEFQYSNGIWNPLRIRTDKTKIYLESSKIFGNDFKVAKNNWQIIGSPITEDIIMGNTEWEKYYKIKKNDGSNTAILRKFNNLVKSEVYRIGKSYLPFGKSICELGAGHGGDLWKICSNGFNDLLFIDADYNALFKDENCATQRFNVVKTKYRKIKLECLVGDFSKPINSTGKKYSMVSCQFAMHYACENKDTINNFINNAVNFIEKDGIFILTILDGNVLFDKIKEGAINIKDNGYQIKKVYRSKKIADYGQKIKVFVDTIGENIEYLVNTQYLESSIKNNFEILKTGYFNDFHFNDIKLDNEEKMMADIHRYYILRKT